MSENCKMVFEVENLNNASPATVSRCGIIFVSPSNLGWRPLIETWCKDRAEVKEFCNMEEGNWTKKFATKYFTQNTDMFVMIVKDYNQIMKVLPVIMITQVLNLLTAILQPYVEQQGFVDEASFEKIWVYCVAWGCGGLFETEDREKFQKFLESKNAPLPAISASKSVDKETIFDYQYDIVGK
jgi:dynein heavy chain